MASSKKPPESQGCHAEIVSATRDVEEALVVLGCKASDEQVRQHLRGCGVELEPALIAKVREELARSKEQCG